MEFPFSVEEKKLLSLSFSLLKPACDHLISSPSKSNAIELVNVINQVPSFGVKHLFQYILVPVELHLRNDDLSWETKRYLLQCIKAVLRKTNLDDFNKLVNIYNSLFILISDKAGPEKLFVASEEFLIDLLECATLLMSSPKLDDFYTPEKHSQLSFGVYKCILIIKHVKANVVQISAFNSLLALTQTHDDCQSNVDKQKVAELVKQMLPGIVLCCSQTVSVGALQNHSVTICAVKTWSKIIALVMKDNAVNSEISLDSIQALYDGRQESKPVNDWYKMANSKLATSTDSIMAARNHPHWKARLEVVYACREVLITCFSHMSSSVNSMLETLIILSQDDMIEVSSLATDTLDHLFNSNEGYQFENILEENLYNLLKGLSFIIDTNNESHQISSLHLLKGYLKCLGHKKLSQLMTAQVYLELMISSLVTIVELETSHVSLIEDSAIKEFDHVNRLDKPWRLLRHFTDTKLILSKIEDICSVLGQSCDVIIVIQYLLDVFDCQLQNRREISLLLIFILENCNTSMLCEDRKSVVGSVLDVVLNGKVWNMPLSVLTPCAHNGNVADNIAHARCNIVLACLLCEVVGAMGQCLGSELFRPYLLTCLYPLMEIGGSRHELLSLAGMQSIQSLVRVCRYSSMTNFITDNIDYLSHHITIQLRHGGPLVLDVIKVILQGATEKVLPCIEDILELALRQAPNMFSDDTKKISHLNMYLVLVTRIRQWHCNDGVTLSNVAHAEHVLDYLQDLQYYTTTKTESETFEDVDVSDDDNNDATAMNQPEPEIKEEVPKFISMVEAILNTCLHFLPTKTLNHQVIVLQIMNEGLQILASFNEDVLLPLVHKVWSPLVNRLQNKEAPILLNHAFNLLLTLAVTSKDFIRARTIKEVIPSLLLFLKDSSAESKLKDSGSAYRLTHQYKLQLNLLHQLSSLILAIGLREKDCSQLLACVSVYLSSIQPAPLQMATVKLFRSLMTSKTLKYIVWTQLMCLWPDQTVSRLHMFKRFDISQGQSEYRKNVEQLYSHFHGDTTNLSLVHHGEVTSSTSQTQHVNVHQAHLDDTPKN